MLVLALDTSTAATSVALVELDAGVAADGLMLRAERQVVDARGHGEHLAPLIAAALAEAMITPRDLSALVAGTGPGAYTGLRVGLVTAAVMSDTLHIPAHGVCSLDGLVAPDAPGAVLAASDARRREVYWARYEDGRRADGPHVDRPADVATEHVERAVGAGAAMYRDTLTLPVDAPEYPSPLLLVRRALGELRSGAPPTPLTPLYLRRPDATVPGTPKPVTA